MFPKFRHTQMLTPPKDCTTLLYGDAKVQIVDRRPELS